MASGNALLAVFPQSGTAPATLAATLDTIAGTSTPAEAVPVLTYLDAAAAYMDFYCVMPSSYAGGGLTCTVYWSAATATNNAIWQAALRAVPDDAEDLDTTAFAYDYNASAASAAPSVVGETSEDNITFTNGADMDSVVAGNYFILRVLRDPAHASDNLANTAYLHAVYIKET
jgi:hypothetical protein